MKKLIPFAAAFLLLALTALGIFLAAGHSSVSDGSGGGASFVYGGDIDLPREAV